MLTMAVFNNQLGGNGLHMIINKTTNVCDSMAFLWPFI